MELTNTNLSGEHFTVDVNFAPEFLSQLDQDQQYWLQYKALREFGKNLQHLGQLPYVAKASRPAIEKTIDSASAHYDQSQLIISDQEVMQDWEHPIMCAMADKVTQRGGDVLEVGFGMGISATRILQNGVKSYTVIECNPQVRERSDEWKKAFPDTEINLVEGRWQDAINSLGQFDGIFFDTYPLNEDEWLHDALNSVSFAEAFFPAAAAHLKPGGIFTYYTGEIDSISNEHQRLLFSYFNEINVSVQRDLIPPGDCQYWWNETMAVVAAYK